MWAALWRKAIEICESWRLETLTIGDPIIDPPLGVKRLIFGFHTKACIVDLVASNTRSFVGHFNPMPKARWCIKLLLPLYKNKKHKILF